MNTAAVDAIRSMRTVDRYRDHKSGVSEEEFRELCGAQNIWHSVDLGDVFIEGARKNSEVLAHESRLMDWPDVRGKSVLDIGAFTGWFSFEADRRGAESVTAIDYHSWAVDWPRLLKWVAEERAAGRSPDPYAPPREFIDEVNAPGRLVFDTTKRVLGSQVRSVVTLAENFASDPFDLVIYLGVLYHSEDPMRSLKKVASLTREHLIIETLGSHIAGQPDKPLWEYFSRDQVNNDYTTWWAPNERGLEEMLYGVGFNRVEIKAGSDQLGRHQQGQSQLIRIWAHAWK